MTESNATSSVIERPYSVHDLAALFTARSSEAKSGPRYVTASLIRSWYDHQDKTGFPDPVGDRDSGYPYRVWDPKQAWEWFRDWEPNRGGAPAGNTNALKHGRYVGVRAEWEARRAGSTPTP